MIEANAQLLEWVRSHPAAVTLFVLFVVVVAVRIFFRAAK